MLMWNGRCSSASSSSVVTERETISTQHWHWPFFATKLVRSFVAGYLNIFALCRMSRTLAAPPISTESPTPTVNLVDVKFSKSDFMLTNSHTWHDTRHLLIRLARAKVSIRVLMLILFTNSFRLELIEMARQSPRYPALNWCWQKTFSSLLTAAQLSIFGQSALMGYFLLYVAGNLNTLANMKVRTERLSQHIQNN